MNRSDFNDLRIGDVVRIEYNGIFYRGIILERMIFSCLVYFEEVTHTLLTESLFSSDIFEIEKENVLYVPERYFVRKENDNLLYRYIDSKSLKRLCGENVYVPSLKMFGRIISIDCSFSPQRHYTFIGDINEHWIQPPSASAQEIIFYVHIDEHAQIEPLALHQEDLVLLKFPFNDIRKSMPNTKLETNLLHTIFQSIKSKKIQS